MAHEWWKRARAVRTKHGFTKNANEIRGYSPTVQFPDKYLRPGKPTD
ncbi:MAG TPA: hypothetical protein VM691_06365 [Myxococcales bacterium]|nr:hypothetical protein [Myxococcales bacterium]